jgi:hypothetical protein
VLGFDEVGEKEDNINGCVQDGGILGAYKSVKEVNDEDELC